MVLVASLCLAGCNRATSENGREAGNQAGGAPKVLRMPVDSDGPKSMDPAKGSTLYENKCVSQVYETLLQNKYLTRPLELEPLLLEEMPQLSEDGLTYHFKLKKGVLFHDDPCFPGGKGRKFVAADVVYSWKRLADDDVSLKSWWVLENTIVGLDEFRKTQNAAANFDYDAPVEGFEILNDHELKVTLKEPVTRFLWTLAMFQTSIVPREAVEKYGTRFGLHPVGTGPYTMAESGWIRQKSMTLHRNPKYHETLTDAHIVDGNTVSTPGSQLPLAERLEFTFFVEEQPMWLQFSAGKLDFTRVPRDNFGEAFNKRTWKLKSSFSRKGITGHAVPMLDFIFWGFNMEDSLLGGYSDEKRYLRQAIALAMDWEERNDVIYNNVCAIYDGMIPPGLDGHPEDGKSPAAYRGPDLPRARELLAKAGYPGGKGLPTIDFYASLEATGVESSEVLIRQMKKIGIEINPRLDVFSSFIESVNNRKAPFFAYAWHSDYPDAENNLALFYGPNEAPGSNTFNYKNPEFDKLYEKIRTMPPSPERTAIYEQMRDMVLRDMPFAGSLARTRFFLVQPWLQNCKPTEDFFTWIKYLDLDESQRR